MSNKFLSTTSAFLLSTSMLVADVPKVTVDIAPVHSLVSKVMNGVGKPDLIIPAGASPHEYQLKPSNAKSLQNADIVPAPSKSSAAPADRHPPGHWRRHIRRRAMRCLRGAITGRGEPFRTGGRAGPALASPPVRS